MMEHVKLFDWCYTEPDRHFIKESDIDQCCTEKILKNRFYDPLLSSGSEDDEAPIQIDWDSIFKNNEIVLKNRLHVPGLKPMVQYPKLSNFTGMQHFQFMKVLSFKNRQILPKYVTYKPSKSDSKAFQDAQETYLKEQKEFIEWARNLWLTDHCIRALRPKPAIETIYEAEFKVRAQRLTGFPKNYTVAAQLPLESRDNDFELNLLEELVSVKTSDLPEAEIPNDIEKFLTILRPCPVPEPCNKHPYQFILPNDKSVSILPLSEIHREIAHFAVQHNTLHVCSENALKCLVELDRAWTLPISVCDTVAPDGDVQNVVVLDSEFLMKKESAPLRTFRALRHLLEYSFVPASEKERVLNNANSQCEHETSSELIHPEDLMTSDDEDHLVIDSADMESEPLPVPEIDEDDELMTSYIPVNEESAVPPVKDNIMTDVSDVCTYTCSCEDSTWEKPPARSFKRWQIRSKSSNQSQNFIVHSAHKVRSGSEELLLEPIPEYQLELGGSKQSEDRLRTLALSLMLRERAAVVNVRVDGCTGEVVTTDRVSAAQFLKRHDNLSLSVTNTIYSALNQLQGLMPGHYVLKHEPAHGKNCILLVCRENGTDLQIQCDAAQLADADEAKFVKTPPIITNVLLPFHKYRKLLPCAFTPHSHQLCKETKKPTAKQKTPPQAIKWPKKKKNRKKKKKL